MCTRIHARMGGDLGGVRGTVPTKFEVGDGPCIRPPNISKSSVIGCVSKYEVTEKGVMKEHFVNIEDFWQERGHIYYIIS